MQVTKISVPWREGELTPQNGYWGVSPTKVTMEYENGVEL